MKRRFGALLLAAVLLCSASVCAAAEEPQSDDLRGESSDFDETCQESSVELFSETVTPSPITPVGFQGPQTFSLDTGSVDLTSGNHVRWIDRVDLPDDFYAFYDALEAQADGALIEFAPGDDPERSTAYTAGDVIHTASFSGIVAAVITAEGEDAFALQRDYAYACTSAAYQAFDRDHPEVFWLSGESRITTYGSVRTNAATGEKFYTGYVYFLLAQYSGEETVWSIHQADCTAESIREDIAERNSAVDAILDTCQADMSDAEIVTLFDDWLTHHNCYNSTSPLSDAPESAWECISALRGSVGGEGPVCEGYARALKVLCDEAGIPCVLVDGTAVNSSGSGSPHMWNYVKVDGNWYAVDTTWNDPVISNVDLAESGAERTAYLLVGGDTVIGGLCFIESHPVENKVAYGGAAFTNGPVLSSRTYRPMDTLEFSEAWSHDDNTHWHSCLTEGYTDLKSDEGAHTWNTGSLFETDQWKYTCTVCGAEKITEIPGTAYIGETEVQLLGEGTKLRKAETNLGDLITDAMLWRAESSGIHVDAAIVNSASIRASIPAGTVLKKDIDTVLPFENTLSVVYVTGAELLETLEAATAYLPDGVSAFPQVSGICFSVDADTPFDQGALYPGSEQFYQPRSIQRTQIQSVGGKPFSPDATYAIAVNDFMAAGGDVFWLFSTGAENQSLDVSIADSVMQYIMEELDGVVTAEQYGSPEGRIRIIRFSGLKADADGVWRYYVDGERMDAYTGLVQHTDYNWYYVENGSINFAYTGLVQHCGTWYYVEGGALNWSYTGLANYCGTWYYVENGVLDWEYTGLVQYYDVNYFVINGVLHWEINGLVQIGGTWYYIANGAVAEWYTGLVQHVDGNWFYVVNGIIEFSYSGLVEYYGVWYCVQGGMLNWNYTGLIYHTGAWYYVENGVLYWNHTGLVEYCGVWYFTENSVLYWNYTGIAMGPDGNYYYVSNSVLDWGYTGPVNVNGQTYQVINGMVLPS